MARENKVELYGYVYGKVRVTVNKDKEPVEASVLIRTVRRFIEVPGTDYKPRYDVPLLKSRDPKIIEQMMQLNEYDMIDVLGVITTLYEPKVSTCPECNTKNIETGELVYIIPMSIVMRECDNTKEDAYEYLLSRAETSNRVSAIGTICAELKDFRKGDLYACQYPIAINRKYRVKGDVAENHTDYPYVRSYGERAKRDMEILSVGSTVLLDASVQTRLIQNKKSVCKNCGKEYVWTDYITELYAYGVEYLFNNRTGRESCLSDLLVKIPDDTPIELRLDELNSEDICQYENKNEIPDELYEYLFSYVSSNASGKGLVIVVSEPIETLADKIETNTYESDYDSDDEEAENVEVYNDF